MNWRQIHWVWLGFFALAFVNGALRELLLKRWIAEPWAHHLSALTAILLFTALLVPLWQRCAIRDYRRAALVGLYWLTLTVLAETFIINRWMGRQSWQVILQQYHLTAANSWLLVLLWIALLPSLMLSRVASKREELG